MKSILGYLLRKNPSIGSKAESNSIAADRYSSHISFDRSSRIWLVGCSAVLYQLLSEQGFPTIRAATLSTVKSKGLRCSDGVTPQITHLIVDADAFGGILGIQPDLEFIRRSMPTLPIILISAGMETEYFNSNRLVSVTGSRGNRSLSVLRATLAEADLVSRNLWSEGRGFFHLV